ncbi:MAG: isochorismate synthase [Azonexus sp.]|nr:isochorismate synthase [Azonexus sp.]
MIDQLRRQLASPELTRRLEKLAGSTPSAAPLSLYLDLGPLDNDWLALLPANGPFWYRARPAHQEFRLGIGHALHVTSAGRNRFAALDNTLSGFCQQWRSEAQPLVFAGFAFDGTAPNHAQFPNALLAIPAILLENINGRCSATLSTSVGRHRQAIQDWLHCLSKPARIENEKLLASHPETLAERAWVARTNAALRDIEAGRLDKIVLSRQRKLIASQPFSAAQILARLLDQQAACLIYAHGNGTQTFLGATPERLVRLQGKQVSADALAGTAWPDSAELVSEKNQHEQSLVIRAVYEALRPLCTQLPQISPPMAHPAGHLMHLRSEITATVKTGTRLFDLVRALHPTPAVGGFPVAAAQAWLTAHGEQRPAWYSGGFGILTPDGDGEFSVALRSALLDGNSAELHAGAGIVAGSDPQQELAETEAKLGTLFAALSPTTPAAKNGTIG